MAFESITVDIDMSEKLMKLLNTLKEIPVDERIPLDIREEYMDKVNEILEG